MNTNDIDRAPIVAEVRAAFARYESALVANDLAALDAFFWDSPSVVRYGANENLYGIDAVRAFRATRSPAGLARSLANTVITTFGDDFAVASTEFDRGGAKGRQQQTWVRIHGRWCIVAAHISMLSASSRSSEDARAE